MDPKIKIAELARLFIGVRESGKNDGPLVRLFQKAVDNKAQGEPYCIGFLFFLIKQVDDEMKTIDPKWLPTCLFKTEGSVQLWEKSPLYARRADPACGLLAVWQTFTPTLRAGKLVGVPGKSGHGGLVTHTDAAWPLGDFQTIEGNTSGPVEKDQREGDGIWEKRRNEYKDLGKLRLLGFLDPWARP